MQGFRSQPARAYSTILSVDNTCLVEPSLPAPVTSSWSAKLPDKYCRIEISRGTRRCQPDGYKMYRLLAPGPWFRSVGPDEFQRRYQDEVLPRLDPAKTFIELTTIAAGRIPALLCFEPPEPGPLWCHRALVSVWFQECLELNVFEVGQECSGCGRRHPKLPQSVA